MGIDIFAVIVAGLSATVVLTFLMHIGPLVGLPRLDMIHMMGTMVTSKKSLAYALGTLSHFVMGVILALT